MRIIAVCTRLARRPTVPFDVKPRRALRKLAAEPPFRYVSKAFVKAFVSDPATRSRWDVSPRPQYLFGLLAGAQQALEQGVFRMTAMEFGVARGDGLIAMQNEAAAVGKKTGVKIDVVGFDTGGGLTPTLPDHRDHVDIWAAGDYPMDVPLLKSRLLPTTGLMLGDIAETAPKWFDAETSAPIGFIAVDVDLYSSTKSALSILVSGPARMLYHVPMYVDDIDMIQTHSKGGELLAIKEYNDENEDVFIDWWRGTKSFRPFHEAPYLERMFVAHDLASISKAGGGNGKRETRMIAWR
jgi:hypothetical protein